MKYSSLLIKFLLSLSSVPPLRSLRLILTYCWMISLSCLHALFFLISSIWQLALPFSFRSRKLNATFQENMVTFTEHNFECSLSIWLLEQLIIICLGFNTFGQRKAQLGSGHSLEHRLAWKMHVFFFYSAKPSAAFTWTRAGLVKDSFLQACFLEPGELEPAYTLYTRFVRSEHFCTQDLSFLLYSSPTREGWSSPKANMQINIDIWGQWGLGGALSHSLWCLGGCS